MLKLSEEVYAESLFSLSKQKIYKYNGSRKIYLLSLFKSCMQKKGKDNNQTKNIQKKKEKKRFQ